MKQWCTVLKSAVLLKALMALSGLVMVGFLIGHLGGNLLIYLGKDVLNNYAAKLHNMGSFLWLVRIGLLTALGVHVLTAIILTKRNRQSRSKNYMVKDSMGSTLASRYMGITGSLIGLYVLFHLAHFTFKWIHPEFNQNPGDVYAMIVVSFQNPGLAGIYVVAMVMMGLHLYHGIQGVVESLGLYHAWYIKWWRKIAVLLCVSLVVGFSSIPVAVLLGFIA